jgi:hypothetical protein
VLFVDKAAKVVPGHTIEALDNPYTGPVAVAINEVVAGSRAAKTLADAVSADSRNEVDPIARLEYAATPPIVRVATKLEESFTGETAVEDDRVSPMVCPGNNSAVQCHLNGAIINAPAASLHFHAQN